MDIGHWLQIGANQLKEEKSQTVTRTRKAKFLFSVHLFGH